MHEVIFSGEYKNLSNPFRNIINIVTIYSVSTCCKNEVSTLHVIESNYSSKKNVRSISNILIF